MPTSSKKRKNELAALLKKPLLFFPFILVFFEVINYLSNDMYLPALPALTKDFNISMHTAQMTLTVWFLGTASMQLFLGPLSDRIGRRPVVLGGGLVFIGSTFYCAFTPHIYFFLLARYLQGCAVCAIGTAGYSAIHVCFEQRDAIYLLAIMGSITILSPAFGPLAGSILLYWLSWPWTFGVLGILAVIGWILLWRWMPESNPAGKSHRLPWHKIGQNYSAIFFTPRFTLNMLILCCISLTIIAWIATGPFLVVDKFKFNTWYFSLFQILIFSSLMLGAQIVRHFAKKIDLQLLINTGLFFVLIGGGLAFILAALLPQFLYGLIFSLMLLTFGFSLMFGPLQRIAIEACIEPMGARMAVLSSLLSWFSFMGGMLVTISYDGSLLWMGKLLLGAAILACILRFFTR